MGRFRSMIFAFGLVVIATSCGMGSNTPRDEVVLDEMVPLKDGTLHAWKLPAGLYRVEMTASGDGAQIEWLGGSCPKTGESKAFSGVCELAQDGQLIVSNPSSFGLGAGSTVTVKITKLGR